MPVRSILLSAAIVVAVLAEAHAQEAPMRPVIVTEIAAATDGVTRQFFGQVAAAQTVDLAFQVGGQLAQLPAIEGATIPQGEVVAELDLAPFELALDQARVRADQAGRALERLTRLQGSAVSQVAVDDAETEADLAQLAVAAAELDLAHATLRAPFDALVASRNVANFSTIAAGTPVVRLHDMSDLRIEIDVPEILFQRAGEDPNVSFIARFPATEMSFPVSIREFNAEASALGQTFGLTLGMTPPDGFAILPGSSATIIATISQDAAATPIPPSSVSLDAGGAPSVLVFVDAGDGTGRLERRAIELGADEDGRPLALSGLSAGEEIVAAGVNDLEDGMTVRRFTGFPD